MTAPSERAQRYADRIKAARGGHDLQAVAAEAAPDYELTRKEKAWLTDRYAARCRKLWPHVYKRRRSA